MDYYKLLGVKPSAHPEEIRTAFRRMAKRAHPDAHPLLSGPEQAAMQRRFIQLVHAYEILSDSQRRVAYDRKLRAAHGASYSGAAPRPGSRAKPSSARPRPAPGGGGRATRRPGGPKAAQGRAGAKHRATPPPQPETESVDMDALMGEVQELLQQFGVDMRDHFGDMLDKMLDWALTVFVEVMQALEGERSAPEAKTGEFKDGAGAGHSTSTSANRPTGGKPVEKPRSPRQSESDLEAELKALKQQVRSSGRKSTGRSPSAETIEDALRQIKQRAGKK